MKQKAEAKADAKADLRFIYVPQYLLLLPAVLCARSLFASTLMALFLTHGEGTHVFLPEYLQYYFASTKHERPCIFLCSKATRRIDNSFRSAFHRQGRINALPGSPALSLSLALSPSLNRHTDQFSCHGNMV